MGAYTYSSPQGQSPEGQRAVDAANAPNLEAIQQVQHQAQLKLLSDTLKWNAALHANAANAIAGTPVQHPVNAGSSGSSGGATGAVAAPNDPYAALHAQFDAQRNQINAQTMLQVAGLIKDHASAAGGITGTGAQAMKTLKGLSTDATQQNALSNAAVKGDYAGAQGAVGGQYQALLHDLTRQGASTQALGAEEGAQKGNLAAQGGAQQALSARLGQLLQGSLNDRQALSTQTTQGSMNDIQRVLDTARATAEQAGTNSLNTLSNQEAAAIQQMQAQAAAAAKRGGGGGGGGGSSSSKGLSAANAIALAKFLETGDAGGKKGADYTQAIKDSGIDMSNPQQAQVINGYLNDIASGKISASQAIANANSRGIGSGNDSYTNTKFGNGQGVDLMNLLSGIARNTGTAAKKPSAAQNLQLFQALLGS